MEKKKLSIADAYREEVGILLAEVRELDADLIARAKEACLQHPEVEIDVGIAKMPIQQYLQYAKEIDVNVALVLLDTIEENL